MPIQIPVFRPRPFIQSKVELAKMKIFKLLILALAMLVALGDVAMAQTRKVALVIGNAHYDSIAVLRNPESDARALADKLTQIGFDVTLQLDLNGSQFRRALGAFSSASLNADIVLVFYAGHGIELNGENYLVPIDADMSTESTAAFEAVALDDVMRSVRNAKKLGLILLDACRDNPYAATIKRANGTRSVHRGLANVSVAGENGVLVSFAAEAGSTADDGDGAHSPYTTALLDNIGRPGLEIGQLFRAVRAQVKQATDGKQVPIERAQLPDENLYFVPPAASPAADVTSNATSTGREDPTIAYTRAIQSGDRESLEGFLRLYPDYANADVVRGLLLDLADDDLWQSTLGKNSENAFRIYLGAFENPRHKGDAMRKLQEFEQAAKPVETAPVPDSFARYPNVDISGNDLTASGYRPVSLEDCEALCMGNSNCKAYTYVVEKQWCWPKSAATQTLANSNMISALRQAGQAVAQAAPATPAPTAKSFTRRSGYDLAGRDLTTDGWTNLSLDECEQQCAENSACVAYTYVKAKNWCWPKYGVGGIVKKSGVISGW
jgi:uncharacterized caspase-like protein